MADIIPFRGLRYSASAGPLAKLISPPYDIISPAQRKELLARDPHNVVRIEFGEDEGGADKYARARDALADWTRQGVLVRDPTPAFYVTEHAFVAEGKPGVRRGLLAALRLYPEGNDQVLPHEQTIPKDRADRMSLIKATNANTSPIFGMVDDSDRRVAGLLAAAMTPGNLVEDFVVGDERHRVWRVDEPAAAARIASLLSAKRVYLADGHHRYEVARAFLEEERAAGRRRAHDDPAAFVLAFICALDEPGLRIFPQHRVIHGGVEALKGAAARNFETIAQGADHLSARIVLAHDGALAALRPRDSLDRSKMPAAWNGIAVAEAETWLVQPAVAAGASVTYTHDAREARSEARGENAAVLVEAVDGAAIKRVADMGERMPQKVTYFYPKVPAGLVLRALD